MLVKGAHEELDREGEECEPEQGVLHWRLNGRGPEVEQEKVCVILLIISHQCQPFPLKVDIWQSLQPKRWHKECVRNNSMSTNWGDRQWVQLNHFCVWPDQQRQDIHHARDGGGRWGGLVFKTYLFKSPLFLTICTQGDPDGCGQSLLRNWGVAR